MIRNTIIFDNILRELDDDLDIEGKEYNLNQFYLDFRNKTSENDLNNQSQSQPISTSEKSLTAEKDFFFLDIPNYLSVTNSTLGATFLPELRSYFQPIDFQDLQQLCMLTYQMSIIHLHQQLWERFLQSSKDQSKLQEQVSLLSDSCQINLSFYPEIVTSIMISQGIIDVNKQDTIKPNIYIQFIKNYLHELEEKMKQCRIQFDTLKNSLPNHTETLADKIDHFVQKEGLIPMQLHFQARIALHKSISIDRSYQLEYFQHKPTDLQLQIAKTICSLTFDKEKTEQELILLKFGLLFKKLPKSLEILEVSLPTSIITISDSTIRERLSNEYQRIIQRAKADLTDVLRSAMEAKSIDCEKKFELETAEIWKGQRQLPTHERLSPVMVTLIEQRQKNIVECLKYIYGVKDNFLVQAPSTTINSIK
ncbi:unnamed protein product [Adineta steineri]|uniref:Uncharacterized protein n=1 Tax=Adineta steineri TaxID=433720 RepID=A0A815GA78_9BILA|nr:unnamed protein product [Adineta steineri]CAF3650263.1 unnamed protein product [Adineta steineri]